MLYIKIIQTALALPLPAPLSTPLYVSQTLLTGAKKAAISLPRFMMTTKRRKTCFEKKSAQGGHRGDIFTGALAPVGPRVEPLLEHVLQPAGGFAASYTYALWRKSREKHSTVKLKDCIERLHTDSP